METETDTETKAWDVVIMLSFLLAISMSKLAA